MNFAVYNFFIIGVGPNFSTHNSGTGETGVTVVGAVTAVGTFGAVVSVDTDAMTVDAIVVDAVDFCGCWRPIVSN